MTGHLKDDIALEKKFQNISLKINLYKCQLKIYQKKIFLTYFGENRYHRENINRKKLFRKGEYINRSI